MKMLVNGQEVELESTGSEVFESGGSLRVRTAEGVKSAVVIRRGNTVLVSLDGRTYEIEKPSARHGTDSGTGSGEARAPMPGLVVEVFVKPGALVEVGDRLLIVEAMKMQQPIVAGVAGEVATVKVSAGDQVTEGQVLVEIKANE